MVPLPADLLGLVACGLLLLLPGLAIVAAPWPVAPLLSLAFWLGSWSWMLALGGSRETFLRSALLLFGGLASLRLFKPLPAVRLPRASLALVVLGLGALGSFRVSPLGTHEAAPRQAEAARLLVARDGWPATRAPFEPEQAFAGAEGLAFLAADVALLSGVPVWRASRIVGLAAPSLLALAVSFLFARCGRQAEGGLLALLAFGLFSAGAVWLDPSRTLAAACALAGLALLSRGSTRAPAVAAGACLACAWSLGWEIGLVALLASGPVAVLAARRAAGAGLHPRLSVAALAWVIFAGPAILRGHPARWSETAALVAGLGLAWLLVRCVLLPCSSHPRAALGTGVASGALGLALGIAGVSARQPLSPDDLRVMTCLRELGTPLQRVCVTSQERAAWLPAVADHGPEPPGGSCRFHYVERPLPASGPDHESCAAGAVQIVEDK